MSRSAIVGILATASALVASTAVAAARVPVTTAVVGSPAKRALVRVDPRTLKPLRGFGKVRLPRGASFALSPNATRAGVSTATEVDIVDTASGRVLRRIPNEGFDVSQGLYWVGSNAKPLIIAVGESKFGYEYTPLPSINVTTDTVLRPVAALRGFLVLRDGTNLEFLSRAETYVSLNAAPPGEPSIAADVVHNRSSSCTTRGWSPRSASASPTTPFRSMAETSMRSGPATARSRSGGATVS
jgi:hypothetical protein